MEWKGVGEESRRGERSDDEGGREVRTEKEIENRRKEGVGGGVERRGERREGGEGRMDDEWREGEKVGGR